MDLRSGLSAGAWRRAVWTTGASWSTIGSTWAAWSTRTTLTAAAPVMHAAAAHTFAAALPHLTKLLSHLTLFCIVKLAVMISIKAVEHFLPSGLTLFVRHTTAHAATHATGAAHAAASGTTRSTAAIHTAAAPSRTALSTRSARSA